MLLLIPCCAEPQRVRETLCHGFVWMYSSQWFKVSGPGCQHHLGMEEDIPQALFQVCLLRVLETKCFINLSG